MGETDSSGAMRPIPIVFLLFMWLGVYLNNAWPMSFIPWSNRGIIGAVVVACSIGLYGWCLISFRRAGTTVDLARPTTAIVTNGPYRFSRNPIYVSLTLLCIGVAIQVDSLWVLLLTIPSILIVHFMVILKEEKYLSEKFGEEYVQYKKSVRRWL
jgi:protein-S-isoprenylcysteine O-methyltransferase Ste14